MPFYLVTHTSLIEADDEQSAAEKAVDQIRAGNEIRVAVKADEATTTHVVVSSRPVEIREVSADGEILEDQPKSARVDEKAGNTHSWFKRVLLSAISRPQKLR